MADDRQPPQSYDTVAPAGVGATTSNQVSPGTVQEILATGDQSIIDQAFEQLDDVGDYDALTRYLESLPDLGSPVQASSPAGVGSQGSQSFRSPQTTPPSSVDSPRTWGSARVSPDPRRRTVSGARTAAGVGGDGRGGRRGPRTRGGGRGGGAGGAGGGRGGAGGAGGSGGAGGGGGGGAGGGAGGAGAGGGGGGGGDGGGGGGGGGGRRGGRRGRRRRRLFPGSPRTPSSSPSTPRGSQTPPPRTLRQADLQRRLRMLLQDQEQLAQGREIANVTMTNSIVTSYKQGGAPSVQTSSARVSP